MKVLTEQEVQQNFDELLDDNEKNPVIVLRDGKVACVMVGIEYAKNATEMQKLRDFVITL
ncbi:type II toxin-antitoxin system Phd/YefM family antitoxin [uncultured Agitococcus sp.]|uniref:type II toxin-antitoxin system Phd/YefM family antitoxin n=1 Tax=uncultured Agitococcus sp. TaxID=1506599 RepID=UPI002609D583|nr:type II toxin-antitoxin system Phd/YefM family antitoxin [uncultured Agitococcus sp.]